MNRRQRKILGAILAVVIALGFFKAILTAGKKNSDRIRDAAAVRSDPHQGEAPGVLYMMDYGAEQPAASPAPKGK